MKRIQSWLENVFIPISTSMANNEFMQSLSSGMMSVLPIMMVGAVFSILLNLPIDAYKAFLTQIGVADILNLAVTMTTELIAVFMTFFIAKSFSTTWGHGDQSGTIGVVAMVAFFVLVPFGLNEAGTKIMEFTYLGSMGMFVGIITGIITARIYCTVLDKDITIKLPAGVPSNVMNSFIGIVPALIVTVVFLIVHVAFTFTPFENIFNCIYTLLQAPLQSLAGNIGSMIIIVIVCQVLWFFGIHGSMTVLSVIFPLWISMYAENATAVVAGLPVPNPINVTFFDFTTIGGCGCSLGLSILLCFMSKSKISKEYGKLFLPCGIFNINEPMVYSMPLMLNPLFLVPFIVAPLAAVLIPYVCICVLGIVPAPQGIMNLSYVPAMFRGFINCGWQGILMEIAIIAMSVLIYYPFFKIFDRKNLEEEAKAAREN
ncbi:PTS sugar transporter subunit IIC [uncultured Dubosiella sp.]|uniref:PTS sugar transporter subunit IIC n=1 Tax=uncultured Dubosiella sp. TaxID=1937011 RepID=UPI0027313901|nr:PTS transporter subunit EIIC [uncultured Dubosiella sp.]